MIPSPLEALQRINETVTVEMRVQRTKCCTGSRQVFLDSELNYRAPENLGVIITESAQAKYQAAGVDDLARHFQDRIIQVHGTLIRGEKGPFIEVSDPDQIAIVK
jgi:hypothetical protein